MNSSSSEGSCGRRVDGVEWNFFRPNSVLLNQPLLKRFSSDKVVFAWLVYGVLCINFCIQFGF